MTRILVVDDDEDFARDIEDDLLVCGFDSAGIALSGEQAIRLAAEANPDLVLMDIRMSGLIDGIEAAEQIKSRFGIPVIYLTALADRMTLQRAKQTEPYGYLLKPYQTEALSAMIELALFKHQTEKEHLAREKRLQAFLDGVSDFIFVLDEVGRITFVNQSIVEASGYSREELIGKEALSFVKSEVRQATAGILQKLLAGEEVAQIKIDILTKDGREIWLEVTGTLLETAAESKSVFCIGHDITKRRLEEETFKKYFEQLEEMVNQRTEDLSKAVERLENAYAIGDAMSRAGSLDYRLHQVVQGLVERLGFSTAFIRLYDRELQLFSSVAIYPIHEHLDEILRSFDLKLSTLDFPYFPGKNKNLDRLMAGQPYLGHSYAELVSPLLDSDVAMALQRLYNITTLLVIPLLVDEAVVGWLAVGTEKDLIGADDRHVVELVARQVSALVESAQYLEDLHYHASELEDALEELQEIRATLEKRVEERTLEISRQKQFFEALVYYSPIAIVTLDLQNRVIACNPAFEKLFGYRQDEAIGQDIDGLIAWGDLLAVAQGYTRTVLQGGTIRETGRRRRKDGSLVDVEIFGVPVIVADEQIGVLALYNDVTERKRAEDAIREARDQAIVLREVGEALSSTLRFEEVLDKLLEQLQRVVPYDSANFMLIKDGRARPCRIRGYERFGANLADWVKTHSFVIEKTPNLQQMYQTRQPLYRADTLLDPGWVKLPQTAYIRSWAGVPVVIQDEVIGFFSLDKAEAGFYGDKHAEMLAVFGVQAALALQNATFYEVAQKRAREAETLRQAGAVVAATLEQEETILRILEQLTRVVPVDSAAVQLLRDEGGEKPYLEVVGGIGFKESVVGLQFSLDADDPGGAVIRSGATLIIKDIDASPYRFRFRDGSKIRSWMGVPLIVRNRAIGLLSLDGYQVDYFNEEHGRLAAAFADHVAIAIENARLFEEVQKLAITDSLTALFNRHHFFTLAEREFDRAQRYKHPLSIVMLDIDDFKHFNDTYGHLIGDIVLRSVADRCRTHLRSVDIVGRYGGEEFIILLPDTGLLQAQQTAERLCQEIAEMKTDTEKGRLSLTVSLGVASLEDGVDDLTLEKLIDRADQALYQAKTRGKCQVSVWVRSADT